MQLKRSTDICLQILCCLAARPDRPTAMADLADALQLSRHDVVKAADFAEAHGWITVVRGRTGGIQLARPAADYRLGDVCRTLEGLECTVDCHQPPCPFLPSCGLTPVLAKARQAFFEELNQTTLESYAAQANAAQAALSTRPALRRANRRKTERTIRIMQITLTTPAPSRTTDD